MKCKWIILPMLMFMPISAIWAQIKVVVISGQVLEKRGERQQGIEGIELWVRPDEEQPIRSVTGQDGAFSFRVLKNQSNIKIIIPPDKFAVLDPRDGTIELSKVERSVEINITVISQESNAELYQEIKALTQKVNRLNIDRSRLNSLFRDMRDSILSLNNQKSLLAERLKDTEARLARSKTENSRLHTEIESLKKALLEKEQENKDLTLALYNALEEKYLRQQAFFRDISSDLKKYLLSVKDMNDQPPKMHSYIKSNNFYNYNQVFKAYNDCYTETEARYLALVNGVARYWGNKQLSRELESTYQYLIEEVHSQQILQPFNQLNELLRLSKVSKIKTKSEDISRTLPPYIEELEQRILEILEKLRDTT